jgi:Tfp pilus assembly protein PilN
VRAVNLIPADQRGSGGAGGPVGGASGGVAYLVVVLLGGLAVLALLYGRASHHVSSAKGEVTSVNEQAQATQARAGELAPYVAFEQMYKQRLHDVSQLVGTRFDWAHAFHELGRVLPSGASLTTVHGAIAAAGASGTGSSASTSAPAASSSSSSSSSASAAAAVASATPAGAVPTFTLSGCATSQTEVAIALQRLRLMDGVSQVALQSSTKGTATGASGSCPEHDPSFSATVTFAPLPAPPSIPASEGSKQ